MSNPIARRRGRISVPRILICSVLLTVLVAACLYVYHTAFDFYQARLLENNSKTLAWLSKQLSFSLPFIIICLFHVLVYHRHDAHDGTASREMFWEVVAVTVLTYAVLLPYLGRISEALHINALAAGETIPKTDGKVQITLLMELHEWFIRLLIPLGVLMAFYGVRARREILFPDTEAPAEPMITIAEYEARKAAEAAAALAEREAAESPADPAESPAEEPVQEPQKEESIHEP